MQPTELRIYISFLLFFFLNVLKKKKQCNELGWFLLDVKVPSSAQAQGHLWKSGEKVGARVGWGKEGVRGIVPEPKFSLPRPANNAPKRPSLQNGHHLCPTKDSCKDW